MNKKQVNDWILPAQKAIIECGIAENGKVDSAFRGQISSFGAAVVMGSLKSAVAFFADDGDEARVMVSKIGPMVTAIYVFAILPHLRYSKLQLSVCAHFLKSLNSKT